LNILLLKYMVFFLVIYVFLQISWIGLFGTKGAYVHLEKHNV
jgi:hypothetical protein